MDNKKQLIILVSVVLIFFLTGVTVQGQIRYGQPASGGTNFTYSYWKMEQDTLKTTLNQFVIPVSGFIPLQDNLEMQVFISSASNSMDVINNNVSLSGLSDLRMQVNKSLKEDRLLLSGGINLPTGKKKLDGEGQLVQLALSQNFLDVPLRRLGEGFGFNILIGGAQSFDNVNIGGGITYQYIGTYDPYEGVVDYNPGDMISINGGIDIVGERTIASFDAIYSLYTDDKFTDTKVFRQSPTFDFRVRLSHHLSNGNILKGSIRYVLRGNNKLYTVDTTQQEVISSLQLFGNEFFISGGYTFTAMNQWQVTPSAELHMISSNDDELQAAQLDNSSVLGFGVIAERPVSEKVSLFAGGKFFTGSADGGNIDLTGLQFTGGLSATF